jgi:hypothetical protein
MMRIIGGNKAVLIEQQPLLKWYNEEFAKRLLSPEVRLMIIGYSFGDSHINRMIVEGANVIGSNTSLPFNPGFSIKNSIIGASRRPLLTTLSGRDIVELNKIKRFFSTKSRREV